MRNYDNSIRELNYFLCSQDSEGFLKLACKIANWLLKEMYVVRKIVRPYLCVNGRQKRHFGVWTLVANFDLGGKFRSELFQVRS